METLLSRAKIAHGRRVFCLSSEKRRLTCADLEKGMTMFVSNEEVKQRKDANVPASVSMYL
jgi:hypothetical protein